MKKPTKGKNTPSYMGIILDKQLKEILVRIAREEDRSVSSVIRLLLNEALTQRKSGLSLSN